MRLTLNHLMTLLAGMLLLLGPARDATAAPLEDAERLLRRRCSPDGEQALRPISADRASRLANRMQQIDGDERGAALHLAAWAHACAGEIERAEAVVDDRRLFGEELGQERAFISKVDLLVQSRERVDEALSPTIFAAGPSFTAGAVSLIAGRAAVTGPNLGGVHFAGGVEVGSTQMTATGRVQGLGGWNRDPSRTPDGRAVSEPSATARSLAIGFGMHGLRRLGPGLEPWSLEFGADFWMCVVATPGADAYVAMEPRLPLVVHVPLQRRARLRLTVGGALGFHPYMNLDTSPLVYTASAGLAWWL